jgi:hypothetical protein
MIFMQFLCAIGFHRWFQETSEIQYCLHCLKHRRHKQERAYLL